MKPLCHTLMLACAVALFTLAAPASAQTITFTDVPPEFGATLRTFEAHAPGAFITQNAPLSNDRNAWSAFAVRWSALPERWSEQDVARLFGDPAFSAVPVQYVAVWVAGPRGRNTMAAIWTMRGKDGRGDLVREYAADTGLDHLLASWKAGLSLRLAMPYDRRDADLYLELVLYTDLSGDGSLIAAFLRTDSVDCLAQTQCVGCCDTWAERTRRDCSLLGALAGGNGFLLCGPPCGAALGGGSSYFCNTVVEKGVEKCVSACKARDFFLQHPFWPFW